MAQTQLKDTLPAGQYDVTIVALGENAQGEPMAALVIDNGPQKARRVSVRFDYPDHQVGQRIRVVIEPHVRENRRRVIYTYRVVSVLPPLGAAEWRPRTAAAFRRDPPCG